MLFTPRMAQLIPDFSERAASDIQKVVELSGHISIKTFADIVRR